MSEGIKKIIRDEVRSELKLHDEYTKLKDDVEIQHGRMYKAIYNKYDHQYHSEELGEMMKKNAEYTYNMYKGWYDNAVQRLKEFEKKNANTIIKKTNCRL